jgi:sugar phosphate isomerase/epimerase
MCIGNHGAKPANMRDLIGRRGFLKAGAATALLGTAAMTVPALAGSESEAVAATLRRHSIWRGAISIQLYTLREKMDENLNAVLASLAAIGYTKVEQAGLHGRTAKQLKAALDRYGLQATSGHHQVVSPYDESRWRKQIEDAYILGQRYMVDPLPLIAAPGLAAPLSLPSAAWGRYAEDLNKAAEHARVYGIKVGYHNHNPEFVPLSDDPKRTGYDILMAETDPKLVHFELDLYWAWYAGKDPVKLLRKYPKRFRQFHVKDMDANGEITAPGTGVIDFARIFKAAEDLGVDINEYIIEQDNAGDKAVTSARLGYRMLRKIRW